MSKLAAAARLVQFLALFSVPLWTRAVHAQFASNESPPFLSLTVDTPEGAACLLPSALAAGVEAELGRAVFVRLGDAPAQRHVLVRVVHSGDAGFEAELTLTDRAGNVLGRRWLRRPASACDTLDEALVLVVSTLAGARPEGEPQESVAPSEPPLQPRPEPPLSPHRAEPAAPEPARERVPSHPWQKPREHFRTRVALSAVMATGLLPSRAYGAAANVWSGPRGWQLGAGVLALPAAYVDLGAGAEARLAALLAQLAMCGDIADLPRAQLSICAAVLAGGLWAATSGLGAPGKARAPALQSALGVRVALPTWLRGAPYVALWASLPIVSTRFYVEDSHEPQRLYHVTQAGLALEVGIILGPRP